MKNRKKIENMSREELSKVADIIAREAIQELKLYNINFKDWLRYNNTYVNLKNTGFLRVDLGHVLIDVAVKCTTEFQEDELNTLRNEIRKDLDIPVLILK